MNTLSLPDRHEICSKCKTVLMPSRWGPSLSGSRRNEFSFDRVPCPHCSESTGFLRREDDEARQNDTAAYDRFRTTAAPLLTAVQRQRAERISLTPQQLMEDRLLRREEESGKHRAQIEADWRVLSAAPPQSFRRRITINSDHDGDTDYDDDQDTVVNEDTIDNEETVVDEGVDNGTTAAEYQGAYRMNEYYKMRRAEEEERIQEWRDRRLETGVVEPRPTPSRSANLNNQLRVTWDLDRAADTPLQSIEYPGPSSCALPPPLELPGVNSGFPGGLGAPNGNAVLSPWAGLELASSAPQAGGYGGGAIEGQFSQLLFQGPITAFGDTPNNGDHLFHYFNPGEPF